MKRFLPVAVLFLSACARGGFGDAFYQLDTNRDKLLTRQEASVTYNARAFREMDRNGSGTVTHAEFNRYDPTKRLDEPGLSTDMFYNR